MGVVTGSSPSPHSRARKAPRGSHRVTEQGHLAGKYKGNSGYCQSPCWALHTNALVNATETLEEVFSRPHIRNLEQQREQVTDRVTVCVRLFDFRPGGQAVGNGVA